MSAKVRNSSENRRVKSEKYEFILVRKRGVSDFFCFQPLFFA
jgi:hypothetical protein